MNEGVGSLPKNAQSSRIEKPKHVIIGFNSKQTVSTISALLIALIEEAVNKTSINDFFFDHQKGECLLFVSLHDSFVDVMTTIGLDSGSLTHDVLGVVLAHIAKEFPKDSIINSVEFSQKYSNVNEKIFFLKAKIKTSSIEGE